MFEPNEFKIRNLKNQFYQKHAGFFQFNDIFCIEPSFGVQLKDGRITLLILNPNNIRC